MNDLLGRVRCVENESVGLIHGEACLHIRPLTLAFSFRIVLRTVCDSSVPQEAISYDILLQKILIELPVLLGRHDLLVIQEDREFLIAQRKNFLNLDLNFSYVTTSPQVPCTSWKV